MEAIINVNMSGEQYIDYLNSRKFKFNKNFKESLPYFILAFCGILLISFIVIGWQPKAEVKPLFNSWYRVMSDRTDYSWSAILKVGTIYVFPYAVTVILISWLLYGVGFVIIRR